jgi:lipid A 3-O-deacylase
MKRRISFSSAILISGLATCVSAESDRGTWFFSVDNDALHHADDGYTSGLQAGWVSGPLPRYQDGPVAEVIARGLSHFPLVNRAGRQRFIRHSVSHRIFTPDDTKEMRPIPDDIPYSALLFGSSTAGAHDATQLDAFTLDSGLVGAAALGEQIQNGFHGIIGANHINGWDNQLHHEPLLNINYEHQRRLHNFGSHGGRGGWGGDIIGQVGGSLGNLVSQASVGIGARFGWGMPQDFLISPLFFGDETYGYLPQAPTGRDTGAWLFIMFNGMLIGNAIFWDGNTFRDSLSINYDPEMLRFYLGLKGRSGQWSGSIALVTSRVSRDHPADEDTKVFGSLKISFGY